MQRSNDTKRLTGKQNLAGMGIEGNQYTFSTHRAGMRHNFLQNGLVPCMNTIESTDSNYRPIETG
jgi:hypothetical protein